MRMQGIGVTVAVVAMLLGSTGGRARAAGTWTALGGGVSGGEVVDMVPWGDSLIVVGTFTMADGEPAAGVALWDGSRWQAMGSGWQYVRAVGVSGDSVAVEGVRAGSGGAEIAVWDGRQWQTALPSLYGLSSPSYVRSAGFEFWRGRFYEVRYSSYDSPYQGPCTTADLMYWDGGQWVAVYSTGSCGYEWPAAWAWPRVIGASLYLYTTGQEVMRWNPDGSSRRFAAPPSNNGLPSLMTTIWSLYSLDCVAAVGDTVFAIGVNQIGYGILVCNPGNSWESIYCETCGGWCPTIQLETVSTYRHHLVAAGYAPLVPSGCPDRESNVVMFDGSGWTSLGTLPGDVHTMAEFQGGLVVAGRFDEADGTAVQNVARYEGLTTPVTFDVFDVRWTGSAVLVSWELRSDEAIAEVGVYRRASDAGPWQRVIAAPDPNRHGSWRDVEVRPGVEYVYRVDVVTVSGTRYASPVRGVRVPTERTTLLPAFPNPFRAATRIRYTLGRPGRVDVAVYDAAGRRVRVLERGRDDAGSHQVTWDGRDAFGRAVPAGVYFVRMKASHYAGTQKVMRMR